MFKKIFPGLLILFIIIQGIFFARYLSDYDKEGQKLENNYPVAKVVQILKEENKEQLPVPVQLIKIKITEKGEVGKEFEIENKNPNGYYIELRENDKITLVENNTNSVYPYLVLNTLTDVTYLKAKVTEIVEQNEREVYNNFYQVNEKFVSQKVKAVITEGDEKGKEVDIDMGEFPANQESRLLEKSEKIIITKNSNLEDATYSFLDKRRTDSLLFLLAIFIVLVIGLSRLKGISSILGLAFSFLIIINYIIPQILDGKNPLLVSLIGSVLIASISMYLAHGFNKRTTISLFSLILTLFVSINIAVWFVDLADVFGTGSEDALSLRIGSYQNINLKGIFLGGVIISCLGILDDVTAAQAAAVAEIKKANSKLSMLEVYKRALRVGKEHISSMVNTLILVYAGAYLPTLLIFTIDELTPTWVIMNREMIAEEAVRSLAGSIALVLAVPITTFLAAHFLEEKFDWFGLKKQD